MDVIVMVERGTSTRLAREHRYRELAAEALLPERVAFAVRAVREVWNG
ncbi:hypothetical protein [Streptomyces cuspidosporus]|uniref:Uncharacterized protein n=1 Tax=Streptomyces cuspidosporus TaxID=66882 RepID=A0ABN3HDA5_9ACTN